VATFARDRMAIEILFRERRDGEDFLYSVSFQGERGAPNEDLLDDAERHPIDRDHMAASRRCKEPGWDEIETELLLMPDSVAEAVLAWARR